MTDYFSLNFINDQKPLFFKELFSKEDATNLKKCKKNALSYAYST